MALCEMFGVVICAPASDGSPSLHPASLCKGNNDHDITHTISTSPRKYNTFIYPDASLYEMTGGTVVAWMVLLLAMGYRMTTGQGAWGDHWPGGTR